MVVVGGGGGEGLYGNTIRSIIPNQPTNQHVDGTLQSETAIAGSFSTSISASTARLARFGEESSFFWSEETRACDELVSRGYLLKPNLEQIHTKMG